MAIAEKVSKIVESLNKLFYKHQESVNLVLLNDDYIYEGIVREALMSTFGYNQQKAYDLMLSCHTNGSVVIWSGEKDKAEEYALILRTRYGLTTEVMDD
jgi:ATP-dependent Clp protease adapter protein ClpS